MPVLRTETKTIPAKTIHTTIIGIPAGEWRRMRWTSRILFTSAILLFLASFFGMMAFSALSSAGQFQEWGIDLTKVSHGLGFTFGLASILTLVLSMLWVKATRLEPALLKKHGWDGKSNYSVELEHQQVLHE